MNYLLFGGSGYIGRHLAAALQSAGHGVMQPLTAQGTRLDLRDLQALAEVNWDVDGVFMLAGTTGTAASFARPADFLAGNESALLNVLTSISRSPHRPRLVFPSSRLVYRGANHPLDEDAPLEAKTVYAANKIAGEQLIKAYGHAYDLPYTVVRICVPYGNQLGGGYSYGTLGHFIGQAVQLRVIQLYGDGQIRRSFTHIEDLCRMLIHAAEAPQCGRQVFNLPGEDMSLLQAAEAVATRLGASIQFKPWPELDAKLESGSTVFDGSHWLQTTGLSVRHNLADWAIGLSRQQAVAE